MSVKAVSIRRLSAVCVLFCSFFAFCPPVCAADSLPSWQPLDYEYYPKDSRSYPKNIENPHPKVREVAFNGKPLDVFTKINFVSQIQLPEPPVLVNIGNPEAYVLDVSPDFASIFIKPITETDMTNMIVTTENGTYIFILKENPYKPWDVLLKVGNPYKASSVTDEEILVEMAVTGKRNAGWQFEPMDIRTPGSTSFIYDAATNVGCKVTLKRIISLPRRGASLYHVQFANIVDNNRNVRLENYVIDEKSLVTYNLRAVAVPDGGTGLLRKNDRMDMFIFVNSAEVSPDFKFRFSMQADRNLTSEVSLKTASAKMIPAEISVDDRIQQMYHEVQQKKFNIQVQQEGAQIQAAQPEQQKQNTAGSLLSGINENDGIVIFGK